MSDIINICLSCDENYAKYAGVVIASVLANAKTDDCLHFYILDENISDDCKEKILNLKYIKDCEIEFVHINRNDFEEYKIVKTHPYISLSACYRLKLASLLPKVDKVIYLDCDVSVCSSLNELFNINLQGKIMAGVLDIDANQENNSTKYVNSGVLLIDLDKMRTQNIEEKLLYYTKNNIKDIKMGDQEIINAVMTDKMLIIDSKYNVQSECFIRRSSFTKNPVIVHFIGFQKPWLFGSWSVHKDLYFKYLQMTPWKLSDKELIKWGLLNKIYSFYKWFCHRPFFYIQPKFWEALKNDSNEGRKFSTNIEDKRVIISLTSYSSRIKTVHLAIQSLMAQTYKADKIILWLAEEQFPNKEKDLPKQLLDLIPLGLTIDWCSDIKSYKKLVPALNKYPDDIIITADDDLIYNKNCVKSLIETFKKHPDCIIANRTHYITFKNGKINKFINWIFWNKYKKASYNVFPTTGGTVLYFPNCLYKDATNVELFTKLAEYTDDHWFWAMAVLNGTKIKLAEPHYDVLKFIPGTQTTALSILNCLEENGDTSMEKILSYYPNILDKLNKNFYQNFFQRIFSIKKEYVEGIKIKIITILGIKIRFHCGQGSPFK